MVCKAHSAFGKPVEIRSLCHGLAIRSKITITKVIGKNKNYIGKIIDTVVLLFPFTRTRCKKNGDKGGNKYQPEELIQVWDRKHVFKNRFQYDSVAKKRVHVHPSCLIS